MVTIGLITNLSLSQVLFQNTMLWLRDSGIHKKLYEDALNAPAIVPYPKVRINQPLNISQLGTAFLVVAGGHILGIMAFLAERYFFGAKIKRNKVEKVCQQAIRLYITSIYSRRHFFSQLLS